MSATAANNNNDNVDNVDDIASSSIAALIKARLELQTAEDAVRDNALAIAAAERALSQARSQKGMVEYNASRKRKAVEAADADVRDALKSGRQARFKAAARGAGLYASAASAFVVVVAAEEEEEEEEEESFTPRTPPGSPKYAPGSPKWVPSSP